MDLDNELFNSEMTGGDICLANSTTTHTILWDKRYFFDIILDEINVNTISGPANLIDGSGRATIMLPGGTNLHINDALYSVRSRRNLLSFKDIRRNGYHIETTCERHVEYLCITSIISGQKLVLEKLPAFSSGLYYTTIRTIESNVVMGLKSSDSKTFMLWHDRLGHPGSTMMRRILTNSHGHPLKSQKILLSSDYPCTACSQGKLVIRPSPTKVIA